MSDGAPTAAMLAGKSDDERVRIAYRAARALREVDGVAGEIAAVGVVRALAQDVVTRVREELSRAVADCPGLPHDIAKRIAHDIDSVAVPFLEVSEVFDDEVLARMVLTLREPPRAALARRARVSGPLAHRLAELGGSETVLTLTHNAGAQIDEVGLRLIHERFHEAPEVLDAISMRDDLPLDVVEEILERVCAAAQQRLAQRYGIPDLAGQLVSDARMAALLGAARSYRGERLTHYVEALQWRRELCPVMIVKAARLGMLEFVEASLAARARIPEDNARRLIQQGNRVGLARLAHRAQVPGRLRKQLRECVAFAIAERATASPDHP